MQNCTETNVCRQKGHVKFQKINKIDQYQSNKVFKKEIIISINIHHNSPHNIQISRNDWCDFKIPKSKIVN